MVTSGGVVYCLDFQTAVLERYLDGLSMAYRVLEKKKVEEKFEANPELMYHFKK